MSLIEPLTVRAERMVAGGDAMARLEDGRVAFVTGALPGEEVEVEVRNDRKDFVKATVTEVLEPSPDRVVPTCPHRREGCGGCGWMHFDTDAQIAAKVGIVSESLRRVGRFDADEVERVVAVGGAVDPYGYRTTIRLVGMPGGGVGFREERSDEVVPIDHCQVAHENLSQVLRSVSVAPGVELTLRTSAATNGVTARWTRPEDRKRRNEKRRSNAPAGESVSGLPADVHIGDRAFLVEQVDGVNLQVSAPSFFQAGPAGAELLVDAVRRAAPELADADHAVDAYGGVGLFAATVMRSARRVTLIESARSSCFDAKENLKHRAGQGDKSVEIVRSDMGDWKPGDDIDPIDVVVADPARPGLAKPGVAAVMRMDAPVVVLVSCDPVSLARDARLLVDEGYRMESVEVFDLFPQTPHVECVTRFVRN
ncbi:MAG: TRAM domain-containing protein [Ilumatobacter sp.]|uniref:class I SAM-dependent RNA methyltransferase n=2 Tax=Ilumatobacter sp. TaxID=1967498 RepID=UPI0032986747